MPKIRLRVRARGQRRILGELTPWKMGCCCACSIIGIITISTLQLILMSGHLFFLIRSLTFFWADPRNIFFPSCHRQTPGRQSEGPMGPPRFALPSPASRFSWDALLHIHFKGYEGQRGQLWTGWWWWLWGALWNRGKFKTNKWESGLMVRRRAGRLRRHWTLRRKTKAISRCWLICGELSASEWHIPFP